MKLIVHGTDGSPEAAEALELAIGLAKDTGAKLALVSVHVVVAGGKGLAPPIAEVEEPGGAQHLVQAAAAKARDAGIEANQYAVTGDPAREITRVADELGADLIVVGSRGYGAIRGTLVGSVSRGVITRSKIPVTVVAHRDVREPATA